MEDVTPDMECVELPGDFTQEYPACCPRLKCVQKIFENELYWADQQGPGFVKEEQGRTMYIPDVIYIL